MASLIQLIAGGWKQVLATIGSSAGAADAGKIPHLDSSGKLDQSFLTGRRSDVLLTGDISSSVTAFGDATGLSFAVRAGVTYRFGFHVLFQAAATTTGIALAMNGPSTPTIFGQNSDIPITVSTRVLNNRRGYDVTGNPGTGVDTAGATLLALVYGTITPSADGTLQLRYASEVATSAVTIKAGSSGWLEVASTAGGALHDSAPLGSRTLNSGTTSDTPTLADIGRSLKATASSQVTFTLPPNSAVPYPVGTLLHFVARGTGSVVVAPGAGVTINAYGSPATIQTIGRFARICAEKVDTNEWDAYGQIA